MNIDDGIVVLSTFNGMSCGMMAFESLGIKVKKYYSVEIDKHANKISNILYPNIIQLGDVTKWESWDIDWSKIDVVLGGSPCQGFSFAGKQLAFDDPRSKLFFEFVKIWHKVKQHNTNAEFLLENVKMKREHELVISRYMGVAPIEINSSLLSAQNRQRLYWTSIANKPFGLFDDMECTIPQPKDKGILLKDVLESDVPEKYYLSEKMQKWLTKHSQKRGSEFKQLDGLQKASCLTTTEAKQNLSNDYIKVGSLKFGRTDEAKQIRRENMSKGFDHTPFQKKEVTGIDTEKMGTLTTAVTKDNLVLEIPEATKKETIFIQRERGYNNGFIKGIEKSPSLTSCSFEQNNHIVQDYKIRRLTPRECGRLQTIPEDILEKMLNSGISDTQLYRMFGNGWTVSVVSYILSFLK